MNSSHENNSRSSSPLAPLKEGGSPAKRDGGSRGGGLWYLPNRLPYNPKLKERTRALRRNPTPTEKKLWYEFLRTLPIRVWRQRPIHHFIVDFYIPAAKLVIEIDGDSHFSESGQAYDAERTAILNGYGLKVLRFTNVEVGTSFEGVCAEISREIGL